MNSSFASFSSLLFRAAVSLMGALLLTIPMVSFAQQASPQQSTLVGYWPNVSAMSEMKSAFTTAAGDLQGDAQIAPAIGLPHFAVGETEALMLSGNGRGCLSVPGQVVDTSGSYTVSAWVKLNRLTGYQTIAGMDGGVQSAFFLQFRDDTRSFAFVTTPADAGQPGTTTAAFLPAQTGRWYWLIGVHDAAAKTQSLYVDGVLQQTRPYPGAWISPGPADNRGAPATKVTPWILSTVRLWMCRCIPVSTRSMAQTCEMPPARALSLDAKAVVPATATLDLAAPEKPSSPNLYGLMIEDIGHSIDGGLYGELIQNRDFKDDSTKPVHWSAISAEVASDSISVDTTQPPPPGTALTSSLKITQARIPFEERSDHPGYGVENAGYWGMSIKPNAVYRVSFYAKTAGPFSVKLNSMLQVNNASLIHANGERVVLTSRWKKYEFTIKAPDQVSATGYIRFVLVNSSNEVDSTIWITHVSLMPPTYNDRPNGARIDLMKRLAAMHPAFLRLPGGNFLEGNTVAERFDWKKTLGADGR